MRENKDAGDVFLSALLGSGYERVENMQDADFLFMDHDHEYVSRVGMEPIKTNKPIVVYPHVPYSWILWDGILKAQKVLCNFVVSGGAKEAMRLFGYRPRVEVVGSAGMEVKPFTPTSGKRLLFAPAHPIHDGKYPQAEGKTRVQRAAKNILANLYNFESVTVRYSNTLEACGLEMFEGVKGRVILENVNVYNTPNIRADALRSIERADLVISNSTFGYLSVASGKPTIFYGYDNMTPYSREGYVQSYELYKHIFDFPLHFETMELRDILNVCAATNPEVDNWKQLNIGENFCKDKFLNVMSEVL